MKNNKDINLALDAVLEGRRSIRCFKNEPPPRKYVEQIIKAGLYTPYAGLAGRPLAEMRRFTVFSRSTGAMPAAEALIMARMKKNAGKWKGP